MARRKINYKKFKDGEMEAEFAEFAYYHKYIIIWNALIAFGNEGIFDLPMIKDKYELTGDIRKDTETICDILEEEHYNGNDTNLNELYPTCWEKLCPCIEDNANFSRGL